MRCCLMSLIIQFIDTISCAQIKVICNNNMYVILFHVGTYYYYYYYRRLVGDYYSCDRKIIIWKTHKRLTKKKTKQPKSKQKKIIKDIDVHIFKDVPYMLLRALTSMYK